MCTQIRGHTYRTITEYIVILQKRDIRIINIADSHEHTDTLFINSQVLKFIDLVEFKTAQIHEIP